MKKVIVFFFNLPRSLQIFLGALATAIPFYFAALLSNLVSQIIELDGQLTLVVHAFVFISFFTWVVFIIRYAAFVHERILEEKKKQHEALAHAYAFMDRIITQTLADVCNCGIEDDKLDHSVIVLADTLQRIVQAAYYTFEAAFGKASCPEERVDFETTFMTKSYRDGKILIPAYANRDARAPRSMVLRREDSDIYSNTITAEIYREKRPVMHLIEDTSTYQNYHELYPGQKDRIKSSIVYPILSDTNELLGTLVVHCDKEGFFRGTHAKFWRDLIEVFSKRLALAKAKLDLLMQSKGLGITEMKVTMPDYFF